MAERMRRPMLAARLSTLSVAYNFGSIALALLIADRVSPQAGWVLPQCGSSVFVGSIVGMLSMGYVGDFVGRSVGLALTQFVSFAGVVASAVVPWGSPAQTYKTIVFARFVVGFGLGGVYPLSATHAHESVSDDDSGTVAREAAARIGDAYFWMSPGGLAHGFVTLFLRAAFGSSYQDLQWRLLLGLGAAPCLAVAVLAINTPEPSERLGTAATNKALVAALRKRKTWRLVFGTGGAWLLYDIVCYGLGLLGPEVVRGVFPGESIESICWQGLVATVIGMPHVLVTSYLIRTGIEPKLLQCVGFFSMTASFLLFPLARSHLNRWGLYVVYCVMGIVTGAFLGVTTFILPASTFPPSTRASFAGIGAALGKVGAVVGTETLPFIYDKYGLDYVFFVCAGVAFFGGIITHTCVDNVLDDAPTTLEAALLPGDTAMKHPPPR